MLQNWPAGKLFWWSCLAERNNHIGQPLAQHRTATIPSRIYPNRRLRMFKSWLLENVWSPWAARDLRRTLAAFQPHVVWVIPHVWAVPPLARILPQAPIAFHTTVQDYIDTNSGRHRFGARRSRRLAALAEGLYEKAATRDATSHPMISDLRLRTGCTAAQMLHAGLEESDFAYLAEKKGHPAGEIRIAYAGTIIAENDFRFFVNALGRIRGRLSMPVRLEFFGPHSYKSCPWFEDTWMKERGNLTQTDLIVALKECTWGLSAMALSDDDPRYNRFSFPTKFIHYLAAGLPVIALGHPESSVVRMATDYKVGVCVTSSEAERAGEPLIPALSQKDPWAIFRPEILRCARTEFDAVRMRHLLHESFFVCAGKTRAVLRCPA
jgi:hypothetical protein